MIVTWERPFERWLEAQLPGVDIMGGFPRGTPVWPVVTMTRVGGSPSWPEDSPRIRVRVWEQTKTKAEALIVKIGNVIEEADGRGIDIDLSLRLLATSVDFLVWAPDPTLDGMPSYYMDATLVFINL